MLEIDSSQHRILQGLVELYESRAARYHELALHVFHQQLYRSPPCLFRSVDHIAIEDEALIPLPGVRTSLCKSDSIWRALGKQVGRMSVSAYGHIIGVIAVMA